MRPLALLMLLLLITPLAMAQTPAVEVKDSGDVSLLRLNEDGGLVVLGGSGAIPVEGAGTRLMWYPALSAFRAGVVSGTQWDAANIGENSVAMGANTTASGIASIALGNLAEALHNNTFVWSDGASFASTATSQFLVRASGGVGIGTNTPSSPLTVAGVIESTTGGFRFPDGTVQTTAGSGGGLPTNGNGAFDFSNDDGLVAEGGTGAIPVEGAGTRLMWYPAQGAFRAGFVSGTQWDAANVGANSVAMGRNTTASGFQSTAMGFGTTASGNLSTAMGLLTTASGRASTAMGSGTTASGFASSAMGLLAEALHDNTFVWGDGASTFASTAADQFLVQASGGVGIGTSSPDREVTIFDNDDDGDAALNLKATNSAAREMLIAVNKSSGGFISMQTDSDLGFRTNGTNRLLITNTGLVGIGTNAPSSPLTVAGIVESTAGGFKFPDGTLQTTAGGGGGLPTNGSGAFDFSNDDGLVAEGGTGAIPVEGPGTRMMWYPAQGAFRAGRVRDTQWDAASVGLNSVAMGQSTIASGVASTAMGANTIASSDVSTAMGGGTIASGLASTAMGSRTTASGFVSMAMGRLAEALHDNTFVWSDGAVFASTAADQFLVQASGGVGIGTSSPDREVTIFDNDDDGDAALNLKATNSAAREMLIAVNQSSGGFISMQTDSDLGFRTNGTNRLLITNTGLVGIGTNTPSSPLTVEGVVESTTGGFRFPDGTVQTTAGGGGGLPTNGNGAFDFSNDDGLVAEGGAGVIPVEGPGTRMMWYPAQGAFRAGSVSSTQWNAPSVGENSVAMGRNTTASGFLSTAMGSGTTASGGSSTAIGFITTASGNRSTAMGSVTTASGGSSTAMGSNTTASGSISTALGQSAEALHDNTFVWGDGASTFASTAADQFLVRASGGVGIGTNTPSSPLTVAGVIESTTGGFRFPDGTVQTTAGGGGGLPTNGNGAFDFSNDDGLVAEGGAGVIPVEGPGTRMMWYPAQSAFRAGSVSSTQWDAPSVGENSVAMGSSTTASGDRSTALGQGTTASGIASTAMGFSTTASGNESTALGSQTTAGGSASIAIGRRAQAFHDNTLVWSDGAAFASTAPGQFLVRASGGVGIGTNTPSSPLTVAGVVESTTGGFRFPDGTVQTSAGVGSLPTNGNGAFDFSNDDGLVAEGGAGAIPVEGPGTRMMWYPAQGAFRAGAVASTQWDASDTGVNSVALGNSTTARGAEATALGKSTIAGGRQATAMGNTTTASGDQSTAMGQNTIASGVQSTAMGSVTTASGTSATAMGTFTTASGAASTAMGNTTTASGGAATAMGHITTASGFASIAQGEAAQALHRATFVWSDGTSFASTAVNQFLVQASGGVGIGTNSPGHPLQVGDAGDTTDGNGAHVTTGGTWVSTSSRTLKEAFQAVDAESVLQGVVDLEIQRWRYRGSDEGEHLGPMAEDFYAAFGLGADDRYIATVDADGVALAAIQGLHARLEAQQQHIETLEARLARLEALLQDASAH